MNRFIPILITAILLLTAHYAFSQGIWKTYTTADGLAGNFVFCIAQDRLGNMWFGTWGGGASKLDNNGIFTNYLTDMYTVIYDIEIDTSNNKWMAIARGGSSFIVKFDDSTFTSYHPLGEPVINAPPNVLGQDSLGQIWCGVLNNSAYWFDGNVWNYFHVPVLWGIYNGISDKKTDH